MGNLLSAPITTKETHQGTTSDGLEFAVSSMQGWRTTMEDAHICETQLYAWDSLNQKRIDLPGHSLFAVLDGHAGKYAAAYAGRNFCRVLSQEPDFVHYALGFANEQSNPTTAPDLLSDMRLHHGYLDGALRKAFIALDKEIALALKGQKVPEAEDPFNPGSIDSNVECNGSAKASQDGGATLGTESQADAFSKFQREEGESGTTACVVLIIPGFILCANAGDSRAVMSKSGDRTIPLSVDHKPDNEEEEQRIRAAGGYVANGRVDGDLAVSRGLGDFTFKNIDAVLDPEKWRAPTEPGVRPVCKPSDQKVSPVPDYSWQRRDSSEDEFIVIACDGIWDVMSNVGCVANVKKLFEEGESNMGLICEEVSTFSNSLLLRSTANSGN